MSTYKEDLEFIQLLVKIAIINEQLGVNEENPKPCLLSVETKNRLEEERKKLNDDYWNHLIDIDRIRIRDWPDDKIGTDLIRKFIDFDIDELWKAYYRDILDSFQDCEVLDRYAISKNYLKLKPPYVRIGTNIPDGIKNIYHESRWCYVYGQHNASIVLSRTVIETVLKEKFNLEVT